MNRANLWRLELGRRIGMGYAANPKARVVMIAGSTGRGAADRYSDLEIDVYWSEPPTDEERRAAAEAGGGTLLDLWPYEEDEWAEEIDVGGFHIGTSTFLVETMERYLTEVLDRYSTEPLPQIRLSSLLHARTLTGEDLVERWRARASAYPPELARAVVRQNLTFQGFGYGEDMLVARDDPIALHDVISGVARQILGALLGLNGVYLPNPSFKGMDALIAELRLTPPDLASRLRGALRLPPARGVEELHALIDDVFDLVDRHLPDVDTDPYRSQMRRRRPVWDHPPEG
ncbi:MAG: hypothetical protein JOZ41_20000 [Chloroflexi bacterium]|nr:hypothetical protein [Chloroflexota bacterium]